MVRAANRRRTPGHRLPRHEAAHGEVPRGVHHRDGPAENPRTRQRRCGSLRPALRGSGYEAWQVRGPALRHDQLHDVVASASHPEADAGEPPGQGSVGFDLRTTGTHPQTVRGGGEDIPRRTRR